MTPPRLYLATGNAGKVAELQVLFADAGFELARFPDYESPPEGAESYTANAALKARALAQLLRAQGRPGSVLADDSGLEVCALGGRPGVLTADYGGASATWAQRRRLLLAELDAAGDPDRRARFISVMHFVGEDGRELGALGTVDGTIAGGERGELGFSFDPIFVYPPAARTFAELDADEKNRVSHRAVAAAAIIAAIRAAAIRLPA